MEEYNIVVVGAGNGGIAAGVALAQKGLKPLVIEQHNLPGGCASSFVRGRFEFDVSLHSMYYDELFRPAFRDGMHLNARFPAVAEELENIYLEDGQVHREYYRLNDNMAEQIEAHHPGCGAMFPEFVNLMMEVQTAFTEAMAPDADQQEISKRFSHFDKFRGMTLEQALDAYRAPAYMRSLLSQFWWYAGQRPTDVPFPVYSGIGGHEYSIAVNFPEETAHGYLAEMETVIRRCGGDIWYNTAVTKILTQSGKVCGVETSQGDFIKTSHVLCNVDPRLVMGNMLVGADEARARVMEMQTALVDNFSFMIIYLGLNCTASELGIRCHHTFFNESLDANRCFDSTYGWEGPMSFGIVCPNLTVPDFSPEGTCALSISVPIQGSVLEGLSQKEYLEKKHEFEAMMVDKVEKYMGIDLKSHIEEIETATPATLSRYAMLKNGGLGILVSADQMQKVMQITSELNGGIVKGLSFVGQYATRLGYANAPDGYQFGLTLADRIKEEQ